MSMIEEAMEACCMMDKTTVSDGEGGFTPKWVEGARFYAVITNSDSTLAQIAEKQGVSSTYNIRTKNNVKLKHPDVVKRLRDGQTFRVTSNSEDKESPDFLSFDTTRVKAEKWTLS